MSTYQMVDLPGGPLGSPGPDIVPDPVRDPATDVPGGPYDPGLGWPTVPHDPLDGPGLPKDPSDGPLVPLVDPEGETPPAMRREPDTGR